jgi:hypothetical protein
MADLGGVFDASTVEPSQPIEILPPGRYMAQIIESEMKETKSGGQMLALTLEITEGNSMHRKLWDNLNLVNANAQAQEIAQRTLSAICHAVGKIQVSNSEQLHFVPMLVTVAVEPDNRDPDRKRNVIKGYSAAGNAAPAAASPAPRFGAARPAAAAPAAPATKKAAPWARG